MRFAADRILFPAPNEQNRCIKGKCYPLYFSEWRIVCKWKCIWCMANAEVSWAIGLPHTTPQQYVWWQIICSCWSTSLERPDYQIEQHWTDNQTFCGHLKTVLFSVSWGRGTFVTVWFLCTVYKCSYLLTYLSTCMVWCVLVKARWAGDEIWSTRLSK